MKKKQFSIEQIVAVLKQTELGMPVADLIRQVGIAEQTFYRWKKQYAGMQSDQVRELKQLQEENGRLKKLVAELSLDKAVLQDVASKKVARPALKREVVAYIVSHYDLNMQRGLQVDEAIAQRPVLSERQGSKAGITKAHAGDCPDTGPLWLPAHPRASQA